MVDLILKSPPKNPIGFPPDEKDDRPIHFHYRMGARAHQWRPPTDVYETEKEIIVRVEIAGMRDSEFTISLNDQSLKIQGVRSDRDERSAFHQMEIHYGEFSTEITLHWAVDSEAAEAEYKDGILRLVLPKAEPKRIQIGK